MLNSEKSPNTSDIELPETLQAACTFLTKEESSLDHFIDCFILEVEVDGKGKNLQALMAQIKFFLKEILAFSDSEANKFIFNFIIALQARLTTLNVQQETAKNANAIIRTQ